MITSLDQHDRITVPRKGTAKANMLIARRRAKALGHELGNFRWERGIVYAYEASCKLCHDYVHVTKGSADTFLESASAVRGTAVTAWRNVSDDKAPYGTKKSKNFCPGVAWRRDERKEWKQEAAA